MLNDVGQAFQRLGTIIKLHEVMIDRIDKNTDDTLKNVEKTRKSLADTHKQVSSGRALMIKVIIIILILYYFFLNYYFLAFLHYDSICNNLYYIFSMKFYLCKNNL